MRGYTGEPLLPLHSVLTVPPDGMCFMHCCCAAVDVAMFTRSTRDARGFVVDRAQEAMWTMRARLLREGVCGMLDHDGYSEAAAALRRDPYPEDYVIPYFAYAMAGHPCSVLVSTEVGVASGAVPATTVVGRGPIVMHVRLTYVGDGAGHRSPHYELVQSWAEQNTPASAAVGAPVPPAPVPASTLRTGAAGPCTRSHPHSTGDSSAKPFWRSFRKSLRERARRLRAAQAGAFTKTKHESPRAEIFYHCRVIFLEAAPIEISDSPPADEAPGPALGITSGAADAPLPPLFAEDCL